MSSFVIHGGKPLSGRVEPIGNKNAVLKMIPASLLTDEPVILTNVPAISDVAVMLDIMKHLGAHVEYDEKRNVVTLQTKKIKTTTIPAEYAQKLRASNVFLGPLLARMHKVSTSLPGGDKIGPREMTAHVDGLAQLGIVAHEDDKKGILTMSGAVKAGNVFLYEPSVTATENVILASVVASGVTTIENAASEPHVQELCRMLIAMGANITGVGTNTLRITGVRSLHGTTHRVPCDYIFVGTMIVLAAITNGEMTITNVNHEDLRSILYFFSQLGLKTIARGNDLVVPKGQKLAVKNAQWARTKGFYSQPWPCFPSDMMSLAIVLATQAKGATLFFEKMYPGRMLFADYLNGMGSMIAVCDPHRVMVSGKSPLTAGNLSAPDLRAGMAYVAAGLAAHGTTVVEHVEHIDRGYPHIEQLLTSLGAHIERRS